MTGPDDPSAGSATTGEVPCLVLADPDDALALMLRRLQLAVLRHPFAARALAQALIQEGHRFASTPEGAEWRKRLAGSDLLRRARAVWESCTLNVLEHDEAVVLPSAYIDALVAVAGHHDLESILSRLVAPREVET